MKNKNYYTTTAILFVVVAVLHSVRVILDLPLVIGLYEIPMWLSWAAVVVTGILAYHGFRLKRRG